MLLHYYARPTDYALWASASEPNHASSCAVREAMESFVDEGLLKSKFGDVSWAITQAVYKHEESPFFTITEKGRAMVEHLCAVQIPICKWIQPSALASEERQ
jgi:hypothetical protein